MQQDGGHVVVVGLRGFATTQVIRLCTYILQKQFYPLEINPDYGDADWQNELRQIIISTGQDNKHICLFLEEYRITN